MPLVLDQARHRTNERLVKLMRDAEVEQLARAFRRLAALDVSEAATFRDSLRAFLCQNLMALHAREPALVRFGLRALPPF